MSIISDLRDRFITKPVAEDLAKRLEAKGGSPVTWEVPLNFNNQYYTKAKPVAGTVTYATLRNMARYYEVARACINIRKRQIGQLNWKIIPIDKNNTKYAAQIPVLEAWFATVGGYNTKFRKFLDMIVEDLLVIDAMSVYKRKTRNGALIGLQTIDPTTIKLRVDEAGMTPVAPEVAYEQWIRGNKVAEMSTDELIWECLNPKSDTPYGFSPLEALVLNTEAALRGQTYAMSWFTDGNLPEGFYSVPENWTLNQIQAFQEHFDAMLAGDPKTQRKVKFMPAGGTWQPAKDFDFNGLKPYLDWLMHLTCALYQVSPQRIGFTQDVNRANGEVNQENEKTDGIQSLATAIEEIFNQILWKEPIALTDGAGRVTQVIGPFPELKFSFLDLDVKDSLRDAEVAKILIPIGAMSVDEFRKDKGLEPIGLPAYIQTAAGPVLASTISDQSLTVPAVPEAPKASTQDVEQARNAGTEATPKEELKRWQKKALADLKQGRTFRKFYSDVLDTYTLTHLEHDLAKCTDRAEVKSVFELWERTLDEGITYDAERLLKKLNDLV